MYVYPTLKFSNMVEQYHLQTEINQLVQMLEKTEGMDIVGALFEPFPPYLKRRLGKFRLLAKIVRVGNNRVVCLLSIWPRDDILYKDFVRDPRGVGKHCLDPLLDQDALQRSLAEFNEVQDAQQHQIGTLKSLPSTLYPWLEPPGWGMDPQARDLVIYESAEWVKRFRNKEINDYWQTYHDIISNIFAGIEMIQDLPDWPEVKLAGKDDRYVLFSEIETSDTPARQLLFLLAPFKGSPSGAEITQVTTTTHPIYALHENPADLSLRLLRLDEVAPFASRAYPWYLLADKDNWLEIEREKEANLALSPDEEQVLRSISMPAPGTSALPIFINGRAGSGKSTMLFYVFADYCYRKQRQNLPGDPLFLTYNEELLRVARDSVHRLLSSHHRFLAERPTKDEVPPTDVFFRPFQKFLIEDLLPIGERERFDRGKYMSFYLFKRLYRGEPLCEPVPPAARNERERGEREKLLQEREMALQPNRDIVWSPELCWHVIRAFIKGYCLDGYMDPDDYQEVPRRDRIISDEAFTQIYRTVWQQWYMPITTRHGYWDDQDLIRKVLELKCYCPKYTAVFCDEAQDFTRLELQLILRLSAFSQYDLGYQPIRSLPFAFAGDPFQTLNPTGFRWESVQAAFYEEVIAALDPEGQLRLVMNRQELAYNYRSTQPIVHFTNLVQLWRHVLFGLDLQPQICWKRGEFPDPQKFILDQNISPHELRSVVENTIIIVPCEEGQEVSYIREDVLLSQIFPDATEQDPPKNVLSAIKAKGLEFKRVILYKFGETCDRAVWELLSEPRDHPVEFEYFFNKLYVAATRAMERLFVVDSREGDQRLWIYAQKKPADLEAFLKKAKDRRAWEEHVQLISLGAPESVREMLEDDPLSIAREFEMKGLNLREPDYLRRAKKYYRTIGYEVEADLCEAWAMRFEEKFCEAGKLFLRHSKVDEAWECFWEGMCWVELADWYERYPDRRREDA